MTLSKLVVLWALVFGVVMAAQKPPATQKPTARGRAVLETPPLQFTLDKRPGHEVLAEIAQRNQRGVLYYLQDGKPVPLTRENLGVSSALVREFLRYCARTPDFQPPALKGGPCNDAIDKMRKATATPAK